MRTTTLWRLASLILLASALLLAPPAASAHPDPDVLAQIAQAGGGILKVYSNVNGARVLLNGEELGQTPVIRLLAPGRYMVRLELAGYESYQEQIDILANKAVTINAQLAKIVGSIEVTANVDGAKVSVNGREVGMTPSTLLEDLQAGSYKIEVSKPGYGAYSGSVTVKPNVRLKLRVELVPNAASVSFVSNQEGATVTLDGQELGNTPLSLDTLSAGRHSLRVSKEGFSDQYRVFQVDIGQKLEINAVLTEEGGGLRVRTRIPGAKVLFEGSLLGETPLETSKTAIQPGQYSLRLTMDGYAEYIQPVVIERNRLTRVSATLISLEVAQEGGGITPRNQGLSKPITERWWFWPAVGGVALAAAGGTTAAVLSQGSGVSGTGDVISTLP